MDRSARLTGWLDVVGGLDLRPTGWTSGYLHHRSGRAGYVAGSELQISVGLLLDALPVRISVHSAALDHGWLLMQRAALAGPPSQLTGDPAFDEVVGIVLGGEELLLRLAPSVRAAVRRVVALGGWFGGCQAALEPEGIRALTRPQDMRAVIDAMLVAANAVFGVRGPGDAPPGLDELLRGTHLTEYVERYEWGDPAAAVDQAVGVRLERAVGAMTGEMLARTVTALWVRSSDRPGLLDRLPNDPEILPLVRSLAAHDPSLLDAVTRWGVRERLWTPVASEPLPPGGVTERLLELLQTGPVNVRRDAARGLGLVGGRAAEEPLARLAKRWWTLPPLRGVARDALERIRSR